MKTSVIIPTLNEHSCVGAAVESALRAGADEVLVADGGSTDGTADLAVAAGARLVRSAPGRAVQQNAGADAATGDVFLFLHADCRLPADAVPVVVRSLQQCPAAVGGFFRQRIDHPARVFRWIEFGNLLRARMLRWPYGDQAIFTRRRVFHSIGGFPLLDIMEDLYLAKQLNRRGTLVCIDRPLTVSARRWVRQGAVRQTLRNWSLLAAVHLGVSPQRLARHYPRAT